MTKSTKVEDWFITPLEAHFESQPTEGGRETIINDMEEYATEDLTTAVEWLKRARQSVKTFPSPKECIKAIKAVVGGRTERAVIRGTDIDATNYASNAVAFCAGLQKVPVIQEGTPQWDEWIVYWEWLGVRWLLAIVRDRKSWTVPSEFPGTFDPRFNATQRAKAA
jgi:hypothetical protein